VTRVFFESLDLPTLRGRCVVDRLLDAPVVTHRCLDRPLLFAACVVDYVAKLQPNGIDYRTTCRPVAGTKLSTPLTLDTNPGD
jgi:hypothetical protein